MRDAPIGAIYEWRADNLPLALGRRLVHQGGAALVIDYGHVESAAGDTLQAVGGHAFVDPLHAPGRGRPHRPCRFPGAGASPPKAWARASPDRSSRREFLRNLGIEKRAATLAVAAPRREKAAEIDSAIKRLLGEGRTEMGKLFKVIGLAHPSIGPLPGFEPEPL